MIRAARGLLNLDQVLLGKLINVSRRTIVRLEADTSQPTNPRRIQICIAIREVLEEGDLWGTLKKKLGDNLTDKLRKELKENLNGKNVRFIYEDKNTGEGVVMKNRQRCSPA